MVCRRTFRAVSTGVRRYGIAAVGMGAIWAPVLRGTVAFEVYGEKTLLDQVRADHAGEFYRLEKERFELVRNAAFDKYLDRYWAQLGRQQKMTPDAAREVFMAARVKIKDTEVDELMGRYASHPKFKDQPRDAQAEMFRSHLQRQAENQVLLELVDEGQRTGKLKISLAEPQEPIHKIEVKSGDPVRYGPRPNQTKPLEGGCSGAGCEITIIEFSEMQCPFCARALPTSLEILEKYQGKIRWITKEFLLPSHDRAREAALANRCAGDQGKYWEMYEHLLNNQSELSSADLSKHARKLELDVGKFESCLTQPGPHARAIDENMRLGTKLGVKGTPNFFVNGIMLGGAVPASQFEEAIRKTTQRQAATPVPGKG